MPVSMQDRGVMYREVRKCLSIAVKTKLCSLLSTSVEDLGWFLDSVAWEQEAGLDGPIGPHPGVELPASVGPATKGSPLKSEMTRM